MANEKKESKSVIDKVVLQLDKITTPDIEKKNPFLEQDKKNNIARREEKEQARLKGTASDNIAKAKSKYNRGEIDKTQLNNTIKKENVEVIQPKEPSDNKKAAPEYTKSIEAKKIGLQPIKPIPNELNNQYVIQGDEKKGKYYFKDKPELEAFRDKGSKLITKSTASSVAKSMVALAESKQWETIKLSGSAKFKREVWMEANLRGMSVEGYKPTKQDLQNLEDRQNKIERTEKTANKNIVLPPKDEKSATQKTTSSPNNIKKSPIDKTSTPSAADKSIPGKRNKVWKEETFVKADKEKMEPSKADVKVLAIRSRLDQADKDKANIAKFIPQSIKVAIDSQQHNKREEQAKNTTINDHKDNQVNKEREKKDELRKAYSELSKQEAIKKFPGLEPLYNLEKAAQQFVEHGSNKEKFDSKGKERFVTKIRENSLETLSKGQALPIVKERATPDKTHEKEAEVSR